jgi:hypothetical protein
MAAARPMLALHATVTYAVAYTYRLNPVLYTPPAIHGYNPDALGV